MIQVRQPRLLRLHFASILDLRNSTRLASDYID